MLHRIATIRIDLGWILSRRLELSRLGLGRPLLGAVLGLRGPWFDNQVVNYQDLDDLEPGELNWKLESQSQPAAASGGT